MQNKNHHKLIIIGSGPAGLTAAIYAARANLNPLILNGNMPGGQLMNTTYVENWPGEKRILGPDLMKQIEEHAQSFGTQTRDGVVTQVDFKQTPFTINTDQKEQFTADSIIIATGSSPKTLNCPGEKEYWGKGVTTCAVCDGAFYKDKKVIIVGGGDSAMENASFMLNFTHDITIIHILDKLTASAAMQQRILNNPHIKIIYNSTVSEIKGNNDHVTQVTITNKKTNENQSLAVDAVFITIGLTPNTQVFKGQLDLTDYGYIKLEDHQTKTSVPGIFVAGDAADARYRQAITSAGSGCMAALDAERYLKGH